MSRKPKRTQQPQVTRRTVPKGGTPLPKAMVQHPELYLAGGSVASGTPNAAAGQPAAAILQETTQHQAPQAAFAGMLAPGAPLRPIAGIETPEGPRQWEFPLGYNINSLPRSSEGTTFDQLRTLAALYHGIQLAEAVWFDVMARLEPKVTMRAGVIPDGESDTDAKWATILDPIRAWVKKPDGVLRLSTWLTASVRDVLELGTSLIWKRRDKKGDIIALDVLDAALWKPVIDQRGRLPRPPYPAYVQFVNGLPAGWYTAENLIAMQETARSDSVYPISRVEKILLTIQQALRHQNLNLTRYTDGAVPEGMLFVTDPTGDPTDARWEQIERSLNGLLAGNDVYKSRIKVIPPGLGNFKETRPDDPKTDYDRWLLNLTAAAFGVTMAELGITEEVNKSSGDSQENVIFRRVVRPVAHLYQEMLTEIIQEKYQDDRVILEWGGIDEADDELKKAQTYDIAVKNGAISPSAFARLMKLPVEQEVPAFISTQAGMGGIVTMDMIGKAAQFLDEDRAQEKAKNAAALEQQQNIDKQMEAQAKQQARQDALDAQFGTDEPPPDDQGPPPTGGATPPPPAPPGEAPPAAAASTDNPATGVNDATVVAQVDHLIAQARQKKAKAGQRMVVADDLRATYNADSHPRGANGKWIGTGGKDLSKIGGLRAEVALDRHESLKVAPYDAKYGRGAHAARQAALTAKAAAGAAKLTAADRSLLKAHVATLKQDLITLSIQAADHKPGSPAEKAIKREMYARVTAESLILQHLYREQPTTKRAQMPTEEPYADRDPDQPRWPARDPHPVSERRGARLGGRDDDAVGRSHAAPVASPDRTNGSGAGSPTGSGRGVGSGSRANVGVIQARGVSQALSPLSGTGQGAPSRDTLTARIDNQRDSDGRLASRMGSSTQRRESIPAVDPTATRAEWKAYREKALKAVKAGQVVPVWQPVALPDHLFIFAQDALRRATTPEDVRAVFAEVQQAEQHPAACRCMVCGCGLPHDDHGMPYPTLPAGVTEQGGAMIAFMLPYQVSERLIHQCSFPLTERYLDLHCTLVFLGKAEDLPPDQVVHLHTVVEAFARQEAPVAATISGIGRFSAPDGGKGDPIYASLDSAALGATRDRLCAALTEAGIGYSQEHGFTPHVTLSWLSDTDPTPDMRVDPIPVTFSHLWCCIGDRRVAYPLGASDHRVALPDLDMLKVDIARSLKADLLRDLEY